MSSLSFSLVIAESLYNSEDCFPVDFDLAWEWLGYSAKDKAKRSLLNSGFERGIDFELTMSGELRPQGGLSNKEQIKLTAECLKNWAMMSGTEKGKEVRRYFLDCEKAAKEAFKKIKQLQPTEPELDAAKAIAEIHSNVEYISPRIAQRLIDARLNRLDREQGNLAFPPAQSPLLGATEIAEDLGYKPDSSHWSSLGRFVAIAYRESGLGEPLKEKRICNGRMTDMKVYPSNEPIVREAIHQFYRLRIKSA